MSSVPYTATANYQETGELRIALVGGGTGGLSLAIGLLKYPHIDVHIYEAAPSSDEIGAGVALGPNAQRALKLIGPDIMEAFRKHATGNMWVSHANRFAQYVVGKGDHEGKTISMQSNATGMQSVHRAHFLNELIHLVPAQRAHFNKRLVGVEDRGEDQGVQLSFKDGTTVDADAVIGADGIHSVLRVCLLGKDHPAAYPVFAGAVAYPALVPMDRATESLGAEYAQKSMMLCGPGAAVLSYPIEGGEVLNIAIMDLGDRKAWEEEKWIVPAKRGEVTRLLEGWGETGQRVCELFDPPDLAAWAMFDYPPAPFYNKGRAVLVGDAAHATTPFQGQGAGQAIEDALVLETILGVTKSKEQIPNAFAAFDQLRRARTQRVCTTSREAGKLFGMKAEGVGDDLEKMGRALDKRMHWIWQRDMKQQRDAGVKLFDESL